MKYVALLRGINVGGNTMIKMADLKAAFEKTGFENVSTYINSGNVIFESSKTNIEKITDSLESELSQKFGFDLKIVVRSFPQMKKVIDQVPATWKKGKDLRMYLSFLKDHLNAEKIASEIKINEGVDFLDIGDGVLYMSTKMGGLTKSGFTKLVGTTIYKEMTMRNLNTVQKILSIMETK